MASVMATVLCFLFFFYFFFYFFLKETPRKKEGMKNATTLPPMRTIQLDFAPTKEASFSCVTTGISAWVSFAPELLADLIWHRSFSFRVHHKGPPIKPCGQYTLEASCIQSIPYVRINTATPQHLVNKAFYRKTLHV
jgi:hypothetical protein